MRTLWQSKQSLGITNHLDNAVLDAKKEVKRGTKQESPSQHADENRKEYFDRNCYQQEQNSIALPAFSWSAWLRNPSHALWSVVIPSRTLAYNWAEELELFMKEVFFHCSGFIDHWTCSKSKLFCANTVIQFSSALNARVVCHRCFLKTQMTILEKLCI